MPKLNLVLDKNLAVNPSALNLKLSDPTALKVVGVGIRMPSNTPITELGLTSSAAARLTLAAKKLTKRDLEALATGSVTARAKVLTVEDIRSVQTAFGSGYHGGNVAADVSCCCCTPCCCAAAVKN